jgi:hypothetical protein
MRYGLGTTFRGRGGRTCTVVDFLETRNLAGSVVKSRYVATSVLMGQVVTDSDVLEIQITMHLIEAAP